jgi:hypothetical protein
MACDSSRRPCEENCCGIQGGDSPKVLRFSIDINSSVPGSSGAGVFGIGVKRIVARTWSLYQKMLCICLTGGDFGKTKSMLVVDEVEFNVEVGWRGKEPQAKEDEGNAANPFPPEPPKATTVGCCLFEFSVWSEMST